MSTCRRAFDPESVYNISGGVLQLCGDAGPPLTGALGVHFVFPSLHARQLCSLEDISEAAGSHGIGVRCMSFGLTTHASSTVMAEISSPLDSVDFGPSEHRSLPRLHRSSEAVAQPRALQPGSSPGLSDVTCRGNDGRIDSRLGSSVRGHANFGAVVRTAEPVAHKPLGAGSSVLSSKGFSATAGTAACTDSHRQVFRVCYINPRHSLQTSVRTGSGSPMGGPYFSLHQNSAHPGLMNRGADMLSRKGNPQGEWRLSPESRAEVDLFATSENAPAVLLPIPLPAGRRRSDIALASTFTFTFTFMHLADAFIQSDLQLHSGYTFLLVHVFPGNRTHNLSLS